MSVLVKAPGNNGGTFYVKRDEFGRLVWSIYSTNALADEELESCRCEFPELEFIIGD
jgi:hypothetical protein